MPAYAPLLLFLFLCAAGCKNAEPPDEAGVIAGEGTIRYFDLEGGFYGLVADDGARYDVAGLDSAFKEDGLRVRFRVRPREDVVTIRMWGMPVEVVSLERIEGP